METLRQAPGKLTPAVHGSGRTTGNLPIYMSWYDLPRPDRLTQKEMKNGWLDRKYPGRAAVVINVEEVYSGAEKLA